jgi:hypothetical protein
MKYSKNKFAVLSLLTILTAVFLFSFGSKSISLAQTNAVRLSVGSASSVAPGSSVDLNVSIDSSNSSQSPTDVQWDFIYSPSNITSIVWKSDGQAVTSAGKSVTCAVISAGDYRCFVAGFNSNTIGNGILGTITATITNSPATSFSINFSRLSASNIDGQSIPITGINGVITIKQETNQDPLTATCHSSVTSSFVGSSVRWTANAAGGTGAYQYEWSGSENLSGNSSSANISYTTEGSKTASVRVVSGTEQTTAECPTVTINKQNITGWCGVSVSSLSGGVYNINWSSSARTQAATTTKYSWSGTDELTSSNSTANKKYTSQGFKSGNLNIQSGTQSLTLNCGANVSVNATPVNGVRTLIGRCSPSVSGMKVTWNASGSGGNAANPVTYSWIGTDGLATTTPRVQFTYSTEGIKTATATIQSGNQSLILTCQAKVAPSASGSTSGGGGCFIATAAFGTDMEPEVVTLRNFRDETLLPNPAGKMFVEAYYKISPPIANFIRGSEPLKAAVRAGLEPIVFGLDKLGYNR